MNDELNKPPIGGLSGTTTGYTVEARYNYAEPRQFGDIILHKDWRPLQFHKSPIGVHPFGQRHSGSIQRESLGLFGYSAAEALRWWFISECEMQEGYSTLCLETRIVAHKITYALSATALEAKSVISGVEAIGGDIRSKKAEEE